MSVSLSVGLTFLPSNCSKTPKKQSGTDGRTDGRTDTATYRVACTRLKRRKMRKGKLEGMMKRKDWQHKEISEGKIKKKQRNQERKKKRRQERIVTKLEQKMEKEKRTNNEKKPRRRRMKMETQTHRQRCLKSPGVSKWWRRRTDRNFPESDWVWWWSATPFGDKTPPRWPKVPPAPHPRSESRCPGNESWDPRCPHLIKDNWRGQVVLSCRSKDRERTVVYFYFSNTCETESYNLVSCNR